MFRALLHGKLSRRQENMEDLVTSMVFGTLEHCDPRLAIAFLRQARRRDGTRPLAELPDQASISWKFWPPMANPCGEFCEPDVLLDVWRDPTHRVAVLLEVKYRWTKSSFAEFKDPVPGGEPLPVKDQLAREWVQLEALPAEERWVLYVTADSVMPEKDLEESAAELASKHRPEGSFAWLSLRALLPLLRGHEEGWLRHLADALRRLDLDPFEGISAPVRHPRVSWSLGGFDLVRRSVRPAWSFGGFHWPRPTARANWTFGS